MNNPTKSGIADIPQTPSRRNKRDLRKGRTALLIGCIVIVYLVSVTNRWWPSDDSAMYLSLARSLYEGQGYQFNGELNLTVTPGLPIVLAGIRAAFGEQFWAYNLLISLCGLMALFMIYRVLSLLDKRDVALPVMAATAFCYAFHLHARLILTDMPFTMLFWTMLYTGLRYQRGSRWWLCLVGLLTVACIFVRAPGLLLVGPAALGLGLDCTSKARWTKRLSLAGVIILAAVVTAGAFYIYVRLVAQQEPYYVKLLMDYLSHDPSRHLKGLIQGLLRMPTALAEALFSQRGLVFREMGFAAMLLAIVGAINLWRRGRRLITVLVIAYPLVLIVFGGGAAGARERYIMPIHPLLVYAVIEGLCWCLGKIQRQLRTAEHTEIFRGPAKILVAILIVCNGPRLARDAFYYSYLSHTPRFYEVIRSGKYAELFEVAERLQRSVPEGPVGLVGDKLSVLHLLTHRRIVLLDRAEQRPIKRTGKLLEAVNSHPELRAIIWGIAGEGSVFLHSLDKAMNSVKMTVLYRGKYFLAWQAISAAKSIEPPDQGVAGP